MLHRSKFVGSSVHRALRGRRTAFTAPQRAGRAVDPVGINVRRQKRTRSQTAVVTAEAALNEVLRSDMKIFVHGGAANPQHLLRQLRDLARSRKDTLRNVQLSHIHLEGDIPFDEPDLAGVLSTNSMFLGGSLRKAVAEGRGDVIPVFLSDIPELYRSGRVPVNCALIQVSLPDAHGYCSFGVTVTEARAAVEVAEVVIAQMNPQMPRTFGDGFIHMSNIDFVVEVDEPLPAARTRQPSAPELAIGQNIADMVEDGSCLQMGIGSIPNAALKALTHHRDLGVHTEMFSDGLLPLIESGVVNNMKKKIAPGKVVSSFAIGSRHLYDYMDDNPSLAMLDCGFVNDPRVISRNDKVVAINSCIEVDLTGQVCADSIGTRMYSGVGGQLDFMRGASFSRGGKPIMAFTSRTPKGICRIVPTLKDGAGVVTTRCHLRYVVTEYGSADLFGKNLRERAAALTNLAHPDDREDLERAAHERFH